MDNNCFYCAKDQRLQDLMIEIRQMDTATLYLFKEQTYRGRCVVALNRHVRHLTELSDQEVAAYWLDVSRAAKAIEKAFHPDKINYGIYGDTNPHLHCHLVPKYEGGFSWGGTFEMMPAEKKLLSDSEYQALIGEIKKYL